MTVKQWQQTRVGVLPPLGDEARPPALLLTLCFLLPLIPLNVVLPGPLLSWGSPAKMIAMVMLGLVVLTFAQGRGATARRVNPGAVVIVTYFFVWTVVWGVGLTHPEGDVVEASKARAVLSMLPFLGVALYTMARVRTERQRNLILGVLVVGLVYEAVIGIIQHIAAVDQSLLLQPPGFVRNLSDQGRGLGASIEGVRKGVVRAYGTAGHPIEFSTLMAVTLPMAFHLARYARSRHVRSAAAMAAVLALIAIPTAVSRTGFIALLTALLIYIWCVPVRKLAGGAIAGLAVTLVGYVSAPDTANAVWQTIVGSADDPSVQSRVNATVRASQVLREQPIFGLGAGTTIPKVFGFIDNQWLQNVIQGGLLGLFGMILLVAGGALGMAVALRSATGPSQRSQFYAIGSAFGGILATSFTFDLFSFAQVTFVFFIMFGLLWSTWGVPKIRTGRRTGTAGDEPGTAASVPGVSTLPEWDS